MKLITLLSIVIIFANCNKKVATEKKEISKKEVVKKQPVTIHKYKNDSIVYDKTELDSFKIKFPEMASVTYPLQPDVAYAILSENGEFNSKFSSETGQDEFCILYTYFLKEKNGKKYDVQRENLIAIFLLINEINRTLNYGGTYFMHQLDRINAYAEYAIYTSIDRDYFDKKYSVDRQKKIFTDSLRQHILDEEKFDFETTDLKEKKARRQKLLSKVDKIETLITDYFYLNKAQEFQYSNY